NNTEINNEFTKVKCQQRCSLKSPKSTHHTSSSKSGSTSNDLTNYDSTSDDLTNCAP
ncbi:26108_t:CDS:1, partial [Gigaspora rosea]